MTNSTTEITLHISADGVPLCDGHYEKYIHDPSLVATHADYDAYFQAHGKPMTCHKCRSAHDAGRNQMGTLFLGEVSAERRGRDTGTSERGGETSSISPAFLRYWRAQLAQA
jgi:hypothetical protein